MLKNLLRLRIILLTVTAMISAWFVFQTLCASWKFICLNSQTPVKISNWEVKKISDSRYALLAIYRYWAEGKEYQGQTLFSSPTYLNYYAAENALKTQKNNIFNVWYQKNTPSFSSLQKRFPKKECTNACLTIGVFIYFYFARGLLEENLLSNLFKKSR